MKIFFLSLIIVLSFTGSAQNHPIAYTTFSDIQLVKQQLNKLTILHQSYNDIKKQVDPWLNKDIDVPVPKDAAGGYTHDKHKSNYLLIFNSSQRTSS